MLQNSILLASVLIPYALYINYNTTNKRRPFMEFLLITHFQFLASSYLYYRPFYIYTQMSTQYDIPFIPTYQFLCRWLSFKFYNAFLTLVLLQLRIYINTRNTNQGISPYSLVFLGSLALFLSWILKLYIYRQGKIISLDVIDWIWYSGRIISCVKFMPIISMNWFDQCVVECFPTGLIFKFWFYFYNYWENIHTF